MRYMCHWLKAMRMPGFLLMIFVLASCNNPHVDKQQAIEKTEAISLPKTLGTIPLPGGYKRIEAKQ